jgi:hypothetical protein
LDGEAAVVNERLARLASQYAELLTGPCIVHRKMFCGARKWLAEHGVQGESDYSDFLLLVWQLTETRICDKLDEAYWFALAEDRAQGQAEPQDSGRAK